jgi:hypothetical protein
MQLSNHQQFGTKRRYTHVKHPLCSLPTGHCKEDPKQAEQLQATKRTDEDPRVVEYYWVKDVTTYLQQYVMTHEQVANVFLNSTRLIH